MAPQNLGVSQPLDLNSIDIYDYKVVVDANEGFKLSELTSQKPKKLKELWTQSKGSINATLAGLNETYKKEQDFTKINILPSLKTLKLELTKLHMIRKATRAQLSKFTERKFCGVKSSDCRFYGLLGVESLTFAAGLAGVIFSNITELSATLFVATYGLSKINDCLDKKQLSDEKQKAILREIKGKFSEINSIETWIKTIEISQKTMEEHFKEQHKTPPGQRKKMFRKPESFWDVLRNATIQNREQKEREERDGHESYVSTESVENPEPVLQEFYCNLAKEVERRDSTSTEEDNNDVKSEEGGYVFNED